MLQTQVVVAIIVVLLLIALSLAAVALRRLLWRDRLALSLGDSNSRLHGIDVAGYVFGSIIIAAAALSAVSLNDQSVSMAIDSGEFSLWDFGGSVLTYGLLAISLFAVMSRMSLYRLLGIDAESAVKAENSSVAIVSASSSIAHALILAAAISGESTSPGPLPPLVFSLIGVATLWLCTWLFRKLTSYDDSRELIHDNVAAALSYGGLMIGIGMIVAHAVEGDFVGWNDAIRLFTMSMTPIILLYPLRQIVVQSILLRQPLRWIGGALDDEIAHESNVGAGALEAATYIAAAYLICCVTA